MQWKRCAFGLMKIGLVTTVILRISLANLSIAAETEPCSCVPSNSVSCPCSTSSSNKDNSGSGIPNSVETMADDMELPHEGQPHGVPLHYDWALQPRLYLGNNAGKFTAMTAWGQVYEDNVGNPARNTRVQLRNMKAYVLSKADNKWYLVQSSEEFEGAEFREDFAENISRPADVRNESASSISIRTGGGYNFHFWPAGRATINPTDIGGLCTTVQAKLIVHDSNQPDDRASARYLVSVGADYWIDLTTGWNPEITANDGVGVGRFRYVEEDWQSYNMCTLTREELLRNPPPLQ